MTQIAAADKEAMSKLFTQAVAQGCKTAGIAEKSPENTPTVFADHQDYIDTVEAILSDDKKDGFKNSDLVND